MKRLLAIALTAFFITTVLPVQLCADALSYAATDALLAENSSYLLKYGDTCITSCDGENGLYGVSLTDEVPASAVWQYTENHTMKNGDLYLACTDTLTVTADEDAALTVSADEKLHFYDSEYEIFVTYSEEVNLFGITEDESAGSEITVENMDYVPVTGIDLTDTEITVEPDETYTIRVSVLPENATDTGLTFESSDTSVVTVDDAGVITAHNEGNAQIGIYATGGSFSAVCYVTVSYTYHTVRFYDMNSTLLKTERVREGESAEAPELPVHNGYEFTGWLADFDCIMQDTDVYSSWSITIYDIVLVLNGGSCDDFPTTYTVESGDMTLPVPTRRGYVFSGWYDNAEFEGDTYTDIPSGSFSDITLYAAWTAEKYQIRYETGGGDIQGAYFTEYTIESPDIYLPQPIRTAYTFSGWYLNPDLSGLNVTCIQAGSVGNFTFYAKWTPTVYTISYETNGGAFADAPLSKYTTESGTYTLPVPSRPGYSFSGWYDNPDFAGEAISVLPSGSYGNIAYYAKWLIVHYSIQLVTSGGTVEGNCPAAYTIEDEAILLPTVSKRGYTYLGWYDNADFTGSPYLQIDAGSVGDRVFYARFEIVAYTISFCLNGGEFTETVPAGYNVESQTITLPVPSRTAYTFDGWYTNPTLVGPGTENIPHGSVGDMVFYAKWTAVRYSVSYVANGGEFVNSAITSYTIDSGGFMLPAVTRRGYDFGGWYDNPSFTGNTYTYVASGSYGDRVFYAQWSPTPYSISYNTNGGTLPSGIPTVYNIESPDFTLPVPSRTGYDFGGWYTDAALTGNPVFTIAGGSVGNLSLYADWDIINYTITYNTNGGTVTGSPVYTYNIESDAVILPDMTRRGYTFRGWYTNPSFTGLSISVIPAGSVGDLTLYARFDIIYYSISYHTNGGSLTSPRTDYTVESYAFSLPEPERLGYSFAGWYYNPDFTGNPVCDIPRGSVGNIEVYAKWDIIHYSISFHVYGGQLPDGCISEYTIESPTLFLPSAELEGHVLLGWYDNPDFTGNPIREIAHGSYGDRVFYASWRRLKYHVRFFDRDYATLLSEMYVEHGMSATPPEYVPEHTGCHFTGWSGDYSCIKHDTDFLAVYELNEYTVTFTDIDYSVISVQTVKHGFSATAPTPPEHEGCQFAFWSCDFSRVTEDLTVIAVYRATTVTPKPVSGQRFVRDNMIHAGEDYIIIVKHDGTYYALTSLSRYEDGGLWGLPVIINGYTIQTEDASMSITDAVFHAEASDSSSFTLTSETSGGSLAYASDDFTVQSTQSGADSFSYVLRMGNWKLFDKTHNKYLRFMPDDGYFTSGNNITASNVMIYKRINLPDYVQAHVPYLNKLYTIVAVRPDGKAYALTGEGYKLISTPVETAGENLYFCDNVEEQPLAFRFVFGDNTKGFSLRCADSMKYLGIDGMELTLTDNVENYWVYKAHPVSGDMSLCEINLNQYVFCSSGGTFSAEKDVTHTKIYLFERSRPTGRMGDINLDGAVNTGDAVILLRYTAGMCTLISDQESNADVNGDSEINTGDTAVILRYSVGLVDWLG